MKFSINSTKSPVSGVRYNHGSYNKKNAAELYMVLPKHFITSCTKIIAKKKRLEKRYYLTEFLSSDHCVSRLLCTNNKIMMNQGYTGACEEGLHHCEE